MSYQNENMECILRKGITKTGEVYENHCHPLYELIFVLHGSVSLMLEDCEYTLRPYDIVLIPRLKYHSVFAAEDTEYQRITVLFDDSFIPCEIREELSERAGGCPIARAPVPGSLPDSLRMILEKDDHAAIARYGALIRALLVQALYLHADGNRITSAPKSDSTLQQIIAYIDSHIGEKLLLCDIAAHVFLSPSSVSHRFRTHMKTSLKQYILQKKLSYAAALIQSGVSATEAAKAIGYENYPNFYKAYKKYFGGPPSREKV